MGYSKEMHIGAYILANVKLEVREGELFYCEKHPERRPKSFDEGYCSMCGAELIREPDREVYQSFYDVLPEEEYEDIFVHPDNLGHAPCDKLVLFRNMGIRDKPTCVEDDFFHVEITTEMIDIYVKNFKEQYAEVIEVLRGRVESLEVRFGVINYVM